MILTTEIPFHGYFQSHRPTHTNIMSTQGPPLEQLTLRCEPTCSSSSIPSSPLNLCWAYFIPHLFLFLVGSDSLNPRLSAISPPSHAAHVLNKYTYTVQNKNFTEIFQKPTLIYIHEQCSTNLTIYMVTLLFLNV